MSEKQLELLRRAHRVLACASLVYIRDGEKTFADLDAYLKGFDAARGIDDQRQIFALMHLPQVEFPTLERGRSDGNQNE